MGPEQIVCENSALTVLTRERNLIEADMRRTTLEADAYEKRVRNYRAYVSQCVDKLIQINEAIATLTREQESE
jgi:transposase